MSVIRLLVCGGRHYAERAFLKQALDAVRRKHTIEVLIHGGCPLDPDGGSADMLADEWAMHSSVPVLAVPVRAPLDGLWPAAGPKRNRRMRDTTKPTHGVAFKGDRGTKDMIKALREIGIEPWCPGWNPDE